MWEDSERCNTHLIAVPKKKRQGTKSNIRSNNDRDSSDCAAELQDDAPNITRFYIKSHDLVQCHLKTDLLMGNTVQSSRT